MDSVSGKTYVYAGGRMAVVRESTQNASGGWDQAFEYFATDHLGAVRFSYKVDASGTLIASSTHDYEPFGLEIGPIETSDNTHRFTGHERDAETGNDYMHFRFYGNSIGRFMKPDNVTGSLHNPQDWNLYSYVHGNPITFNDPTGHMGIGAGGPVGSSDNMSGAYPDNGQMPDGPIFWAMDYGFGLGVASVTTTWVTVEVNTRTGTTTQLDMCTTTQLVSATSPRVPMSQAARAATSTGRVGYYPGVLEARSSPSGLDLALDVLTGQVAENALKHLAFVWSIKDLLHYASVFQMTTLFEGMSWNITDILDTVPGIPHSQQRLLIAAKNAWDSLELALHNHNLKFPISSSMIRTLRAGDYCIFTQWSNFGGNLKGFLTWNSRVVIRYMNRYIDSYWKQYKKYGGGI